MEEDNKTSIFINSNNPNLLVDDSESSSTATNNITFSSSDSDSSISSSSNTKNKTTNNMTKSDTIQSANVSISKQNATTGIDINNNNKPFKKPVLSHINIDQKQEQLSENSSDNSPITKTLKKTKSTGAVVNDMLRHTSNTVGIINGWDNDATLTIKNWYKIFKQQSFIYQWILDQNINMADKLTIVSIISSSALGIFSGFKLWIDQDMIFQTVSNIILMLFNFLIALITTLSKRYIDDKRNEKIRNYIEELDNFLGEISAQVLKSPVYRMNADEFFKLNNDKYTKLITSAPNLSISELNQGKSQYKNYIIHLEDV
jgi:hypothetical protein